MAKKRKSPQLPAKTPDAKPNDVIGVELRKLLLWGVMACVITYCLLFLMTPFGPFDDRMTRPERFFRFDFFLRLLDVEYFKFAWFSNANTFSFFPAIKIVGMGMIIAAGAFSVGVLLLKPFRIATGLTACERFVFSSTIGLSFLSMLVFVIGLFGGISSTGPVITFGCILFANAIVVCFASKQVSVDSQKTANKAMTKSTPTEKWSYFNWFLFLLAVPSLLMLLFGGILPPIEYDVTSYHVPGARHFYETGRINFVPNNVYVNMPFGVEMFFVLGMIFSGDWYVGTLVGKLIIAYCTLIAGLGVYAFGKRLHSSQAGMVSFLLYVSLPWVNWVSTAGLIDCVFGMYLLLAVFALYLYVQSRRNTFETDNAETNAQQPAEGRTFLYLAGLMAGSAAACKYTAVPFLVLPLGVFALYFACKRPGAKRMQFDRRAAGTLGLIIVSVMLACGLWYAKNLYNTGNPTYPLMYRVFGDRTGTWDAAKNERWHAAHSSTDFSVKQMTRDFKQTLLGSDWLAPALVPLAVLPFLRRRQNQNRTLLVLAAYIVFYLTLWWLLTHRLERFWVPILPLFALLAGVGAMFFTNFGGGPGETALTFDSKIRRTWSIFLVALLTFNTAYTFFPNAVSAPGKYSRFGMGIKAARLDPNRVMPLVLYFNAHPPEGKILLVGDAEVFDYAVPVLYNTCFDDTLFDALFFDVDGHGEIDDKPPMRSPDEMRTRLNDANISHIVVNWAEIARFRGAGNYGYTSDLVQPDVFDRLVRLGVLRPLPHAPESPDGIPTLPEQFVYEVTGL